jgi:hypothetical protein
MQMPVCCVSSASIVEKAAVRLHAAKPIFEKPGFTVLR